MIHLHAPSIAHAAAGVAEFTALVTVWPLICRARHHRPAQALEGAVCTRCWANLTPSPNVHRVRQVQR